MAPRSEAIPGGHIEGSLMYITENPDFLENGCFKVGQ